MAIEISTAEQFMALRIQEDRGTADVPLKVIITADLDFSEIDEYQSMDNEINAHIDGQGHKIKNIYCIITNGGFCFLKIADGTIENIVFDNCWFNIYDWFDLLNITGTMNKAKINSIKINNNCLLSSSISEPKALAISSTLNTSYVFVKNFAVSGTWNSGGNGIFFFWASDAGSVIQMVNISIVVTIEMMPTIAVFYRSGTGAATFHAANMFMRINGGGRLYIDHGSRSRASVHLSYFYLSIRNNTTADTYIQCNTYKALFDSDSSCSYSGTKLQNVPSATLKSAESMRALGWAVS